MALLPAATEALGGRPMYLGGERGGERGVGKMSCGKTLASLGVCLIIATDDQLNPSLLPISIYLLAVSLPVRSGDEARLHVAPGSLILGLFLCPYDIRGGKAGQLTVHEVIWKRRYLVVQGEE